MDTQTTPHTAPSPAQRIERRTTRLRLLGIACWIALAALAVHYWVPAIAFLTSHPHTMITSVLSFIICLAYSTEVSSNPLACRHTVIPLLTIMLFITGTFDGLFLPLVIVAVLCSSWASRSLLIGAIHTCGAIAIIPVINAVLGSAPASLRILLEGTAPSDLVFTYLMTSWLAPLIIITVTIVIVRFVCDLVIFPIAGIPALGSLEEFSIPRILGLDIADFAATVLAIWLPAIFEFSVDVSQILDVHMLFIALLDIYALGLMSFYQWRRLMRYRNSLHSITAITDALPLPHANPEEAIASMLDETLPNVHCLVCEPNHLPNRAFHSYRASNPVGSPRKQRVIVFERSMLNRPFLTADEEVLASASAILSEELRANREVTVLRNQGDTDPLTGASTYASLVSYLKTLQTENSTNTVAIIYIEIERFRQVNEHFGRRVGNMVLRMTASRIRNAMPEDATLARAGGDSFVVMLQDESDDSRLTVLARKLRDATSMPIHAEQVVVSLSTLVTKSILKPNDFSQLNLIIEHGDAEIHDATMTPSDDAGLAVLPSEVLRTSISDHSFTLRYQPVIDIATDSIIGVGAIPHVQNNDGAALPQDFIRNEAVRLSMGTQLTTTIVEKGVRSLTQMQSITPDLHALGITLTGGELGDSAFYEYMENVTKQNPGIMFHLQFGRDAIQRAPEFADSEEDFEALAALPNVAVSVSEAGTSFSEISAFSTIPADSMLLDPSVIQDISDSRTHMIVADIAKSAHRHDFDLVFCGVSAPEQIAQIRKLGCTKVMGDALATAMTESELRMRLATTGLSANLEYVESADRGTDSDRVDEGADRN